MIELPGIHIGGGDAFQTNGVSTLEQAIKLNQDFLKMENAFWNKAE